MSDRLLVFVLTGQKNCEIVMCVDLCRLDTKRLFKLLNCPVQIARLRKRGPKIHPSCNTARIRCHSFAKLRRGFREPLRLERNLPATQMQTLSRDRLLETIDKRIGNTDANSSLLGRCA